jgi:hypothetical protein
MGLIPVRKALIALTLLLHTVLAAPVQAETIQSGDWTLLVPSPGIPTEIPLQKSKNNLDVAFFQGRYYLAFRTAPTHFPSKRAHLYVVSSTDRQNWRLEKEVFMKADLREPRFCVMDTALYFYWFEGGKTSFSFQPQRVWASHLGKSGKWRENQDLHWDGFVPWRIRRRGTDMYMSAYWGRDLYSGRHQGQMRILHSKDGYNWKPISQEPQTGKKGGEEAEFIFDRAGNLWGTVRLEGAGAMIIYADRDSLHRWQMWPTRDKYDSALLFNFKDHTYLVARRNLDGPSERGAILPPKIRRNYNLVRYSLTRKCTALWKLDKQRKQLIHLIDFPSTGDTAFPAIWEVAPGKFWLLNYSSDIHGPRKNWFRGQLGPTYIYQSFLQIKE